jgi:hypothetical protein
MRGNVSEIQPAAGYLTLKPILVHAMQSGLLRYR